MQEMMISCHAIGSSHSASNVRKLEVTTMMSWYAQADSNLVDDGIFLNELARSNDNRRM
jgi:hypothetical protein